MGDLPHLRLPGTSQTRQPPTSGVRGSAAPSSSWCRSTSRRPAARTLIVRWPCGGPLVCHVTWPC